MSQFNSKCLHHLPRFNVNTHKGGSLQFLVRSEGKSVLDVAHTIKNFGQGSIGKVQCCDHDRQVLQDVGQSISLDGAHPTDLLVGVVEATVEEQVQDRPHILGEGSAGGEVDRLGVDDVVGHGRGLEQVEDAAHVAAAQGEDGLDAIVGGVALLGLGHLDEAVADLIPAEGGEAEAGATGLEGRDDLGHVVADEAEAGVLGVLLDDAAEGELGVVGHGIGLVEDDELDALVEELAGAGELLDLVADDVDAAGVGGVELEGHGRVGLGPVHALGSGNDGRRLAGARRAVEEKMGQVVIVDELGEDGNDVLVRHQVFETVE